MIHTRPQSTDYAPWMENYVKLVPEGSVSELLVSEHNELMDLLGKFSEDQGGYRYAPGKWSVKEVIGHIADTERIMSYRLLRIARGDQTTLPGFDQDVFIEGASFDEMSLEDLLHEVDVVRQATISLIKGIKEDAWARKGKVSDYEASAHGLLYVVIGHAIHHRNILKERYIG